MICVSVIPKTVEEAVSALDGVALAEVRLEELVPTEEDVKAIFSGQTRIVATCRPGGLGEERRGRILGWAIDHGASYVDLEIEGSADFKAPLVARAKAKGCKVIVSFHDYEGTPPKAELDGIVKRCFEDGADVAKVACLATSEREAARIMGLADSDRPVIALGMGEKGKVTRVAAPMLGAPFTFASKGEGSETAPGQMSLEVLENVYTQLKVL